MSLRYLLKLQSASGVLAELPLRAIKVVDLRRGKVGIEQRSDNSRAEEYQSAANWMIPGRVYPCLLF